MPKLTKKASKKAKSRRMKAEMHKFKEGTLHSGSKRGPKVTSREQAIAIGLSESGQSRKQKLPKGHRTSHGKRRKGRKVRYKR